MPLRIMSGIALQGAFETTILPALENTAGIKADVEWNPTTLLVKAVREGRAADVIVVTDEAIEALAQEGVVDKSSVVKVAEGLLGLAVRKGAAKPDISTLEAFKSAVTAARSVAFSRNGASGIYFAGLIETLGLADTVRERATIIPAGFTAEKLVTGEADLAVQQLSELLVVEGIDIVGPFPSEIQSTTPFSAAIHTRCADRRAAEAFLRQLTTAEAKQAYEASGLAAR